MAHLTVYADSLKKLRQQADEAARLGPWYSDGDAALLIPDNSTIVVERIEQLNKHIGG